jgi:hypothetical protein
MREATELFDAAMAKSSTKGRVGRPKVTAAPAAAVEVEDADELAEISELEEIVEVEAAALEEIDEEAGDPVTDGAAPADEGEAKGKGAARKMRRRATDD